jgi:hypothetical protein
MSEILPNIRIKLTTELTVTPNDFQVETELLTAYSRFTSFFLVRKTTKTFPANDWRLLSETCQKVMSETVEAHCFYLALTNSFRFRH